MPNRIIKESICISESINNLSWFEEVFFYRLIVNCDDYGRFDGRTAVIKNRLFPLKDNITLKSVENVINKLVNLGLVVLYMFEGKPYLYLPTWNEHQNIRAKRSKYPAPNSEIICNHMNSNDRICSRNPIQSESESNPNSPTGDDGGFSLFWSAYPRKTGKQEAEKAWSKLKPSQKLREEILSGLEKWKNTRQWAKDNGQFIPYPATFLNNQRWKEVDSSQNIEQSKTYHSGSDFFAED